MFFKTSGHSNITANISEKKKKLLFLRSKTLKTPHPCKGTAHNPQSNAIVERVHQVLGDMLRTFELEEQQLDEDNPFGRFLSACAYSVRSTYHTTLQATPAQLVFGRDMILPVNFRADWSRAFTWTDRLKSHETTPEKMPNAFHTTTKWGTKFFWQNQAF